MLMQLNSAWKEKAFFVIEFIKGTESTSLIPKYLKLAFRQRINQALSATSVATSNFISLGYYGFDCLPCNSSSVIKLK